MRRTSAENLTTAYTTVKRSVCEPNKISLEPAASPHDIVNGIFPLVGSERDVTNIHQEAAGGEVESSAGGGL